MKKIRYGFLDHETIGRVLNGDTLLPLFIAHRLGAPVTPHRGVLHISNKPFANAVEVFVASAPLFTDTCNGEYTTWQIRLEDIEHLGVGIGLAEILNLKDGGQVLKVYMSCKPE